MSYDLQYKLKIFEKGEKRLEKFFNVKFMFL
jgi:hypothetical protein